MRLERLVLVMAFALVASACTKVNPNYCADAGIDLRYSCSELKDARAHEPQDAVSEASEVAEVADAGDAEETGDASDGKADLAEAMPVCSMDMECASKDAGAPACDMSDGGAKCVECTSNTHCSDPKKPVCDKAAEKCVECTGVDPTAECKLDAMRGVCNVPTKSCVGCINNTQCSGTKPICDALDCRACKMDAECGTSGICLDTGSCATGPIFVEFSVNGCPGADGTSAKPFCSPGDGWAAVLANKGSVIVIKGPSSGQLDLETAAPTNVTIVGRNDSSGQAPTILLGVLTGIRIAAGNVVVNDLTITGGGSNTAKGVVVSGANTVVVLRRVTIATTQGLGIQVDTGASLTVDQCVVKENAIGGLLINGASYKVMNSVFATSGYGVKFNVPKSGSTFVSNTVVGNAGSAVTCDPSTPQMLVGSIVGGFNDSCVLVDSTAQIPPFDTNRPFHLLSPFPCTTDPVGAPAYDIDGDPRTSPIDCGADQFR